MFGFFAFSFVGVQVSLQVIVDALEHFERKTPVTVILLAIRHIAILVFVFLEPDRSAAYGPAVSINHDSIQNAFDKAWRKNQIIEVDSLALSNADDGGPICFTYARVIGTRKRYIRRSR